MACLSLRFFFERSFELIKGNNLLLFDNVLTILDFLAPNTTRSVHDLISNDKKLRNFYF